MTLSIVFSPQSFVKHNKSFHKLFPEIPEAETLTQSEWSFRSTVCYSFADIDHGDDITHCGPFFFLLSVWLLLCPTGKKTSTDQHQNTTAGWSRRSWNKFFFVVVVFREKHLTTSNDPCCVCVSVCVAAFTCALQKEVLYHGKLFVSEHHVCFHSSVLLKETKVWTPRREIIYRKTTEYYLCLCPFEGVRI